MGTSHVQVKQLAARDVKKSNTRVFKMKLNTEHKKWWI